ncbi:AAC(3) family N-acetyltransferase [Helicobacter sp. 11S03491-1]|uniref:AAC(3) family N-acetyltransferase n=1 Tax=Helicobacter sp. 11S03491-1 TaxID=1476196 RepID=UPI000BA58C81|nr:AAC(3) family N-acetyltransferase [Helicobacter sp. 11S03491-1]PAF43777.1 hypothetical protein BKH45_00475 [Helicobacter sp. 11S03491-1]
MEENNLILFTHQNNPITKNDIAQALMEIKAQECDYLFIHSELSFGIPNAALSKQELLGHLFDIFASLNVANLIVPTFSFSFCAKEDFDPCHTKSPMGILSEYFRKLPQAKRTLDPLMSCALIGKDTTLLDIGKHSCGKGSVFDKLHHKQHVKFLFFGNRVCDCFTYSHYIEKMLEVPYRYDKNFEGNIILPNAIKKETFILPVRYANVEAFKDDTLNKTLNSYHAIKEAKIGKTQIQIVDEKTSFDTITQAISDNIDFMLEYPYPRDFLDKTYIYEKKTAL